MLKAILETVMDVSNITPEVTPEVKKLLKALKGEMSRSDLMKKFRLKDEKNFRVKYKQIALTENLIERTIPNKPNSRLQKYRLTKKGSDYLKSIQK